MLKNNGKIIIGRNFLFALSIISLMFIAFGLNVENSYALELNDTVDGMGVDSDNTVKLENSQDEILEVDSQDILKSTIKPKKNTYKSIQEAIDSAKAGDTIKLSGKYYSNGEQIVISKKLTLTADKTAILDGKHLSRAFHVKVKGEGSVFKNIKFINGNAKYGSAIYIKSKNVHVENCIFEDNHANKGGALFTVADLDITSGTIVDNCQFRRNTGYNENFENYSYSGALSVYGRNSVIKNCLFEDNWIKAKQDCFGGAIQVGLDLPDSNVKVINCIFKNNRAISLGSHSHGGAGCVRDGSSYVKCIFINNSADQGGALTFHASGAIVNCTFIGNTANRLYGGAISTGFLFDYMKLNILDCSFDGNSAPVGGAIQVKGLNILINNSDFKNNHVTKYGGAVNIEAEDVAIKSSIFNFNKANIDGGAVYIKGKNTLIVTSSFNSNEAVPDVDKLDDGLGGAIYINSSYASIKNNSFKFNIARNGSAIYYDEMGEKLTLENNELYQNQAWVYQLPIFSKDIYYGDGEKIKVILIGGNNIAKFDNLAVSNAIYNAADTVNITVDGQYPVYGATNTGELYQDSREYNIRVLLTVKHEDGTVVYNCDGNTNYLGEINVNLDNLKPGKYYVSAKHYEDTYYKSITNITTFTVYPKVDNQIKITSDKAVYNFEDIVVWCINITNNGPNNATGVVASELLSVGLIYVSDTSDGLYDPKTGILNISTLDVGEKVSFNILTIINKTGEITNKVNITAIEFDTNLDNNFDERLITVNPASDIQVVKSVNNTVPNYHDLVNWTILIRNNGPDVAHDILVCDVIPSTLIPINYNSNKLTWKIESLKVNEEIVFNVITLINDTGVIKNTVNASAREFDYDLSNNEDCEIVKISSASDLSIVKSVNASNVDYMDIVKWTLTIKNNGPNNATSVKITDILPEGFIPLNSTLSLTEDMIELGDLAIGESMSIDIICKVNATGNYTNFAYIYGNEYDPNLANNQDNKSITVNFAADLEITKTVDEEKPKNGDLITWTITVKNNGPNIAHDIKVYEALSNSLIWVEDDSSGDYDPQTGVLNIDVLDIGEEYEVNIICQVNRTGIIINDVNVTSLEFDYNLSNNQANESIEVKPSADVNIIKLVNNTNPNYNDLVKWTIIVSNNGPNKATGVKVSEIMPDGLIVLNSTATKGVYDNDLWFVCCLEKREMQTLEIICRVNKTGVITNLVEINATEYDPNSTNNKANESIKVSPAVDIEVIQNVNNAYPLFGQSITWMITVKNNGPDNASEVELSDILPETIIFADYNSTKGEYIDGIWNIGNLNAGGCEYLNITCIANDLGLTVNNAQAVSYEYDWDESNNYDDAQINVRPVADLSIEKLVDNINPNYGDLITWTLIISNNGPNDASNVVVFDRLPKQLEFIKSSDDENYNDGNWHVNTLKTGESKQLTIRCKVIATGLIKNTVNLSSDEFDPDLNNNKADKEISVPQASDLSITKIASKYKYVIGEIITYVIEVVNNGPDAAYNIKINEILDDLLRLKSFKVSKGNFNKFTNVWTINYLRYGESASLSIKAIATGTGVVKNTVSVTSDSFDYDLSNNKDIAAVKIVKKTSKVIHNKSKVKNVRIPENKISNFKLHPTANPFFLLLVSCVVSIIFLSENIFKKR